MKKILICLVCLVWIAYWTANTQGRIIDPLIVDPYSGIKHTGGKAIHLILKDKMSAEFASRSAAIGFLSNCPRSEADIKFWYEAYCTDMKVVQKK